MTRVVATAFQWVGLREEQVGLEVETDTTVTQLYRLLGNRVSGAAGPEVKQAFRATCRRCRREHWLSPGLDPGRNKPGRLTRRVRAS